VKGRIGIVTQTTKALAIPGYKSSSRNSVQRPRQRGKPVRWPLLAHPGLVSINHQRNPAHNQPNPSMARNQAGQRSPN